jgi:hypothetical protein
VTPCFALAAALSRITRAILEWPLKASKSDVHAVNPENEELHSDKGQNHLIAHDPIRRFHQHWEYKGFQAVPSKP